MRPLIQRMPRGTRQIIVGNPDLSASPANNAPPLPYPNHTNAPSPSTMTLITQVLGHFHRCLRHTSSYAASASRYESGNGFAQRATTLLRFTSWLARIPNSTWQTNFFSGLCRPPHNSVDTWSMGLSNGSGRCSRASGASPGRQIFLVGNLVYHESLPFLIARTCSGRVRSTT